MRSFQSFLDLKEYLYFNKNIDVNREIIYGRAHVLALAEIRTMNSTELSQYLNKYSNWYRKMKSINVRSWTTKESGRVALFDYALNKKRLHDWTWCHEKAMSQLLFCFKLVSYCLWWYGNYLHKKYYQKTILWHSPFWRSWFNQWSTTKRRYWCNHQIRR